MLEASGSRRKTGVRGLSSVIPEPGVRTGGLAGRRRTVRALRVTTTAAATAGRWFGSPPGYKGCQTIASAHASLTSAGGRSIGTGPSPPLLAASLVAASTASTPYPSGNLRCQTP